MFKKFTFSLLICSLISIAALVVACAVKVDSPTSTSSKRHAQKDHKLTLL